MTYPIAYQLYSSRKFPPLEAQFPTLEGHGVRRHRAVAAGL